jgi:hypothetical protein
MLRYRGGAKGGVMNLEPFENPTSTNCAMDLSLTVSRILTMNRKSGPAKYANIAVVGLASKELVAVEVISVTADSCDLSGAWLINSVDTKALSDLLDEKLIIFLNIESQRLKLFENIQDQVVTLTDFIRDAKDQISVANKLFEDFVSNNALAYAEYMKVSVKDRQSLPKVVKKNLIAPDFSDWPPSLDLDSAEKELEQMNKLSVIQGTPQEMKKILAASRLIQFLIQMWRIDEIERVNRVYVLNESAENTILPPSWLRKIK